MPILPAPFAPSARTGTAPGAGAPLPAGMAVAALCAGIASFIGLFPLAIHAEIRFQEVSQAAGVIHQGVTYGASWGDFNGDGWPDLWVGNHTDKPSLYLNGKNGKFADIIDQVWSDDPNADTHGAAWADFDNDGDQDLIETVGGIVERGHGIRKGQAPNLLFVNEGGKLLNRAKELGITQLAEARSPLWLDADRDGRLDLLIMNAPTPGLENSTLFRQADQGFVAANDRFGYRDAKRRWTEKAWGWAKGLTSFHLRPLPRPATSYDREFAQLGQFDERYGWTLVSHSDPIRFFALARTPFDDIADDMGWTAAQVLGDVAIDDFDGDGIADVYATSGPYSPSMIAQPNAGRIEGTLKQPQPRGVYFRGQGKLEFAIFPWWMQLSAIHIGNEGRSPEDFRFVLSAEDAVLDPEKLAKTKGLKGLHLGHDPKTGRWVIHNAGDEFVEFIVTAQSPLTDIEPVNVKPFREEGVDLLLLKTPKGFQIQQQQGEAGADTSCHSVVSGDFDNDMDVDLYLVCSTSIGNLPNRLFANDGQGHFSAVADAGGAAGSMLGRGDVAVTADYDRDGFLDLFVTNGSDPVSPFAANGPHQLFRNLGNGNHWLEVDLQGTRSNRDGIGSLVTLASGGRKQVRQQAGGMHRFSQNHQRIHFGLGANTRIESLAVQWPSGIRQELKDLAADHIVRIVEPAAP